MINQTEYFSVRFEGWQETNCAANEIQSHRAYTLLYIKVEAIVIRRGFPTAPPLIECEFIRSDLPHARAFTYFVGSVAKERASYHINTLIERSA